MACMRMNMCAHAEREMFSVLSMVQFSVMVNIKSSLLLGL